MTDKTEEKKYHRVGWWRSLYYYMGWTYDSYNDYPNEDDVRKKQILCKQINLSKLKMNKVIIEPTIPFDLQKIKIENENKIQLHKKEKQEIKIQTMSQKQKHHIYGSRYNNNLP